MNMISTGAFLPETDASTKQNELVKKLTAAWEKKNSKTARAGGASLMALSLAACGGEDNTPFSAADVSEAEAAAKTAALTGADGTVYASVDAAITSNDTAIADAARAEGVASVDITSDNTEVMMSQADYDAAIAAADDALQADYDALVASNAALQASYDALVAPTSGALTTSVDVFNGTTGNDSFTSADGTMAAGDVVSDPSTTDSDSLTVSLTDDGNMGTIVNIEAVTVNVAALTASGIANATSFDSDMGSVVGSNVTINLNQAGGIVDAIVSDLGTGSSVTAGTRIEDLTVDFGGAVSNVAVTGGTAVTVVNGTASKVTGLNVDASAGTNVDVEFGADSSNVTVITGSGTTDINNGAGAKVTNLVVDAALSTGTIDIDTIAGSTVTLTATDDAGAITLVSTNVAGSADTATITASAADLGAGVDGFETINVSFLDTAAGTFTTDGALTTLTADASGASYAATAAITIDADTVPATLGTVALNGANSIILQVDGSVVDSTDVMTVTTDTADTHTVSFETAQGAALDLTEIANGIDINLGVAMATNKITVASGASITADTIQTAALAIESETAGGAVTLDLDSVNHTGSFAFTNVGTLTISNSADMATAETVTVDSNTTGTAGAIVLSGSKDIQLAGATDATSITSSGFSGDLTATLSATIDTITSGSGNDSVTSYATGDWTFDGGAGDDTLVLTGDHSDDTVSFSNVEILDLAGGTVVMTAAQISGQTSVVKDTGAGTITVNGTAGADTIDLSGISTAASIVVTEFDIDAGVGDDTINLGTGTFTVEYTTGADGNDTITGFTTTEDNYDTDFGIANGAAAVVTVTTAAARALNTTADDIFSFTVDSFSDTSEAGVIAAISNGSITVSAAADDGMILINDGTSSWLFEFTTAATDTTLTALDDTITHVATFTDEVIVAADII